MSARAPLVTAALALLVITAAPAPAQSPPPKVVDPAIASGQAAKDLAAARALWKRTGPRSYRYRIAVQCFCVRREAPTITVRGGRPVGGRKAADDTSTLPRLFRAVDGAIAGGAEIGRAHV